MSFNRFFPLPTSCILYTHAAQWVRECGAAGAGVFQMPRPPLGARGRKP